MRPRQEAGRVLIVLAGVLAGAVLGIGLGTAWGGGQIVVVAVLVAVVAVFVVAAHPLVGVVLVPATVGLGNDPIPGVPAGLQAVHAMIGLAVLGVVLHLLLAEDVRLRAPGPAARRSLTAMAAFVGLSVVSGLLGRTPFVSQSMNITLLGVALLAGVTVLTVTTHTQLRLLLCAVVATSVAATAPVLSQLDAVSAERSGTVVDNRPTGAFVDPNELGAYSAVLLVLALVLLCSHRRWEVVVGAVGGGFALLALVLSFSRGSWLAAVIGTVALLATPHLRARLVRCLAIGGAVLGALLATSVVSLPLDAVQARAATLLSGAANPYDVRPYIWDEAVRIFLEQPLLGAGPGSFPRLVSEAPGLLWAYPVVHAHNGPLTVAAENGALGLLAALAVVVSVTRGLLASVRTAARSRAGVSSTALGLLVALTTTGATLAFDYTLRNPLVLTNLWLLAGAAIATSQVVDDLESTGRTVDIPAEPAPVLRDVAGGVR